MVQTLRPIPSGSLRLVVFDLDGTLVDSGADLCASVNAMLSHFARPPLPESVIASYIGSGAPVLVRRALGEPDDEFFLDSAITYFLDYYHEHKLDRTRVYPGVFEALDNLRGKADGVERLLAVLSNKPVNPSRAICDALGLSPYFFRIYGGNSFPTKKPDPEGLNAIIQEAGVTAGETVMIGDSGVDILTARGAGAWSVGCSYGLAPHTLAATQPDCLVDFAGEWPIGIGEPANRFGANQDGR